MELESFQAHLARLYGKKDRKRGMDGTFMYLIEEVGELATALREGDKQEIASELADVLAWTASLAQLTGVDLAKAAQEKYASCSGCARVPCACRNKP